MLLRGRVGNGAVQFRLQALQFVVVRLHWLFDDYCITAVAASVFAWVLYVIDHQDIGGYTFRN